MKASALTQNENMAGPLFEIAECIESFIPNVGIRKSLSALSQMPFADLMLHPEKVAAVLRNEKVENSVERENKVSHATTKKNRRVSVGKSSKQPPQEIKKIEFTLTAPEAKSVKLAADFTDWDAYPLDLMQLEDGVWFSIIPLKPGKYAYRFIVDGQWCDDPNSTLRVPNPFGTDNAIMVVS